MTQDWQSTNQTRLTAALAEVKSALRLHAALVNPGSDNSSPNTAAVARSDANAHPDLPSSEVDRRISTEPPIAIDRPAAIDVLCAAFNLSHFERDILLLCAGMELDSTFGVLCSAAAGDAGKNYPTFSLALAALSEAHWSALTPDGPLRRWRLIDVGAGPNLTLAPLRIDERVLHYLAGVGHLDERLAGMVEPVLPATSRELAPSHAAIVESIVAAWSAPRDRR